MQILMHVIFVYVGYQVFNLMMNFFQGGGNDEELPKDIHTKENRLNMFYIWAFFGTCHLYWA